MSPEQTLADPLEIDTRSDVYALGVILYELLAGQLPYTISKDLHETIHAIREEDPARLSAVSRVYRGDIETIVAKALTKDKAQRYGSAAELAADICRYLKDEPIVARPPSASYQLKKFARRNRALVAGAAAVFSVLILGVAVSARQAARAGRAEREAVVERDKARSAEQVALNAKQEFERESVRASLAERAAVEETDRALLAERTARNAEQRADTERDLARVAEQTARNAQQRADREAATAKAERLLSVWKFLARESIKNSDSRTDDDLAALLARQAFLFHTRTPNQPLLLVEEAMQRAAQHPTWSNVFLSESVGYPESAANILAVS
jgi:hypothetical protein